MRRPFLSVPLLAGLVAVAGGREAAAGGLRQKARPLHHQHQPPADVPPPPYICPGEQCDPHVSRVRDGCLDLKRMAAPHEVDEHAQARYRADWYDPARSGFAMCIGKHNAPVVTRSFCGYYVGGGSGKLHHGDPRCATHDGTFGWDYRGCVIPKCVDLLWSHGRRYQGGTGSYRTDGPPVPNVFALKPFAHLHPEEPEEE